MTSTSLAEEDVRVCSPPTSREPTSLTASDLLGARVSNCLCPPECSSLSRPPTSGATTSNLWDPATFITSISSPPATTITGTESHLPDSRGTASLGPGTDGLVWEAQQGHATQSKKPGLKQGPAFHSTLSCVRGTELQGGPGGQDHGQPS